MLLSSGAAALRVAALHGFRREDLGYGRHGHTLHRHAGRGERSGFIFRRLAARFGSRRWAFRARGGAAGRARLGARTGRAALRRTRRARLQLVWRGLFRRGPGAPDEDGLRGQFRHPRHLPHRAGGRHLCARAVARAHERFQGYGAAVPAGLFLRDGLAAPGGRRGAKRLPHRGGHERRHGQGGAARLCRPRSHFHRRLLPRRRRERHPVQADGHAGRHQRLRLWRARQFRRLPDRCEAHVCGRGFCRAPGRRAQHRLVQRELHQLGAPAAAGRLLPVGLRTDGRRRPCCGRRAHRRVRAHGQFRQHLGLLVRQAGGRAHRPHHMREQRQPRPHRLHRDGHLHGGRARFRLDPLAQHGHPRVQQPGAPAFRADGARCGADFGVDEGPEGKRRLFRGRGHLRASAARVSLRFGFQRRVPRDDTRRRGCARLPARPAHGRGLGRRAAPSLGQSAARGQHGALGQVRRRRLPRAVGHRGRRAAAGASCGADRPCPQPRGCGLARWPGFHPAGA